MNPDPAARPLLPSQDAPWRRGATLRLVRYLCAIPNDRGGLFAWNAARRRPDTGVLLAPPERAVFEALGEWISLDGLRRLLEPLVPDAQLEAILARLLGAELLVTSEDQALDRFPEEFVVVGASIANAFTVVETNAILRGASKIATLQTPGQTEHPFVGLWGHKMVFVGEAFSRLDDPVKVYAAVADRYLDLASTEPHVVYQTFGHPWVGESIPEAIQEAAWRRFGKPTRVVPGISSLDTMFAALRFDPYVQNLAIVRPSGLERVLDKGMNVLIVLVGGYERLGGLARLQTNYREIVREELEALRAILLRQFPPAHLVYRAAGLYDKLRPQLGAAPERAPPPFAFDPWGNVALPLESLPDFADSWNEGASSLFVPRLR